MCNIVKLSQTVFRTILARLNFIVDAILTLGITAMLVLVIFQVIVRSVSLTVSWTEEMTRYIFIWLTFLGMSIGFRRAEHIRLLFFVDMFPQKIRKILHVFQLLASLAFLGGMMYLGLTFLQQTIAAQETAYAIQMPMYLVVLAVPVSFFLAIVGMFEETFLIPVVSPDKEEGGAA